MQGFDPEVMAPTFSRKVEKQERKKKKLMKVSTRDHEMHIFGLINVFSVRSADCLSLLNLFGMVTYQIDQIKVRSEPLYPVHLFSLVLVYLDNDSHPIKCPNGAVNVAHIQIYNI